MRFLIWITAARPGDKQPTWHPDPAALTLGDLLLLFFAHEGLRDTAEGLARRRCASDPSCTMACAGSPTPRTSPSRPDEAVPDFAPWVEGVGACVLEALQADLAARWIHVEGGKERIEQPAVMRGLGASQERVLDAFLARWRRPTAATWPASCCGRAPPARRVGPRGHVDRGACRWRGQRLADRAATYQAATSLLRHLDRLGRLGAVGAGRLALRRGVPHRPAVPERLGAVPGRRTCRPRPGHCPQPRPDAPGRRRPDA